MTSSLQSLRWYAPALLLLIVLLAPGPASASGSSRAPAPCDGVRLLSAPVIAIGLNAVVIDITGPINDVVKCQQVGRIAPSRRSDRASRCENSQVSGARLSRNLAAKAVHCLINKQRSKRGLRALNRRDSLKRAAKRHSRLMVARGCFSHDCPGEPDLVRRVIATNYLPCSCTWTVAENIAWGARRRSTPKAIVDAWMNSPPHRAVIVKGSLRDVDIGVRHGKPGNGNARAATYTADFGAKR